VPVDAAVLALMCDNLPPSLRSHEPDPDLAERLHTTTIEMSVYLRRAEVAVAADEHCLTVLRSASAVEGLHEEAAEVWSPDGRLLATSRQLALVFRRPPA
jgi:acyl-CoA thioesterase